MIKLLHYLENNHYSGKRGIANNTTERLDRIKKYHNKHPGSNSNQLICFIPESKYMVNKYFKTRSVNNAKK